MAHHWTQACMGPTALATVLGLMWAFNGSPALAQRTYTVTTLEGVFDTALRLDPSNRVQGNRSRYSLKGPEGQLSPTGGYVSRSANWAASTAASQQPSSTYLLASQWATLNASDDSARVSPSASSTGPISNAKV